MSKTKKAGVAKKTPKRKIEKEVEKEVVRNYKLEVRVNDLVYEGHADTLNQALADFIKSPQFPFAIKTRCLIRYSDGKKEKQVVWPVIKAHRQFRVLSLKPLQVEFQANKWLSDLAN